MACWMVLCTGKEAASNKKCNVTIDTEQHKWIATGVNVDIFFDKKSGRYAFVSSNVTGKGLQLLTDLGNEAAFFTNFRTSPNVGDGGIGRSEKTNLLDWKLESI